MQVHEVKSLLARFKIKPNKVLGQNFLLSENVLEQIVDAADLSAEDMVLEIGPGLGFLTSRLAEEAGEVIAVEKDRQMCRALRKILKRYKNVKIIHGDALFFSPETSNFQLPTYKLVANIPYYLTGKILQKFLSGPSPSPGPDDTVGAGEGREGERLPARPSLMVLLLQKEVAERIAAKPGEMSLLSVSVQFYSDPKIVAFVPKENFYPVPEVDSAIVRITPLSPPLTKGGKREEGFKPRFPVDEGKFFQLVKIGFSNKRKQLQNNLTAGLRAAVIPAQAGIHSLDSRSPIAVEDKFRGNDKERGGNDKSSTDYKKLLQSLGLNPLCRAQDLSLVEWMKLYDRVVW